MVQGQVFLKRGGGGRAGRNISHHNFMKKGHSKLSKNNPGNIP